MGMDGFIDPTGKLVIPSKFDAPLEFSEGLAFASTWRPWDDPGPTKAGFIDKQGRFVIENDAFRFGYGFSDGRSVVSVQTGQNEWAYGLIDKRGNFVISPGTYRSLSPSVHGAIRAVNDKKVGLIDIDGKVIVPLGKYEDILEPLDGNVFSAQSNGKVVLMDATGRRLAEVAEPGYVGRFRGGMATIEQNGRYGYIDATGAVRIAPQFEAAEAFDCGLALVTIAKTKGYINLQGKFVWKTDRWDEPLRNSVSKPLSTFLPETTVKALPLSYNRGGVTNAIVFVADGNLDELRAWYKRQFPDLEDHTNLDLEPGKLDMTLLRRDVGYLQIEAMTGKEVDGFVGFYACENMSSLRRQYPKKIIGILRH
jgi:hypothetical protein